MKYILTFKNERNKFSNLSWHFCWKNLYIFFMTKFKFLRYPPKWTVGYLLCMAMESNPGHVLVGLVSNLTIIPSLLSAYCAMLYRIPLIQQMATNVDVYVWESFCLPRDFTHHLLFIIESLLSIFDSLKSLFTSPSIISLCMACVVAWVCCWFLSLLQEVFLRVLQLSPLLKHQHFQIPIWSGECPQLVLCTEYTSAHWGLNKVPQRRRRFWSQQISW